MVSKNNSSACEHQKQHEEGEKDVVGRTLKSKIKQLTDQILAERGESVKEKVQNHWNNLEDLFSMVKSVISGRKSLLIEENINMLSSRIENPICKFSGFLEGTVEKDQINNLDKSFPKGVRIPLIEKLPQYTTWVYVARNVRMAKDQSVIGKKQIYHDKRRGETLICSDSEEEMVDPEDVKHEFTEAEDRILWMALEEYGSTEEVLSIVKESVKTTNSQIQGRYEKLKERNMGHFEDCDCRGCESHMGICLKKSLRATLEPFDNIFCRQCLIFDCPMHNTSQHLIYHSEKQPIWSEPKDDRKPCSHQCYIMANELTSNSDWKSLEKDLYAKGEELFGKNSCLIARNLLLGLKTCLEVASYMLASGESVPHGSIPCSIIDRNKMINAYCSDQELPSRSRSQRKKGKYNRKSGGLPPRWRRFSYGKYLGNKQYTPCGCNGICENECPCVLNGTCCEKYCGCSKLCKNRFRGCYCTKSQCRSQLCPCFAANRECDPDVCRSCWVRDSSLVNPPRRGDVQCGNMNLLLGQKERILLAKSNVAGWGAFAKNPVNKDVCLGEYTGELITHEEGEKRGKLYDRVDTSFLFNLNDQWDIDAHRLGDKLKFANHSLKPNCYAKVMLVGGDHRVGIFAKENIEAGDELLYDYCYNLDSAPLWALPPNAKDSKKYELVVSQGKAKKRQSR